MLARVSRNILMRKPIAQPFSVWLTLNSCDTANIAGFLNASEPLIPFMAKIKALSFHNLYLGLDVLSREFFFSMIDMGLGVPFSVFFISFLLKFILTPLQIKNFIVLRTEYFKRITDKYQEKLKLARSVKNKEMEKKVKYEYEIEKKKEGINTFLPLINILGIPLYFTWAFSLRYMCNLPEVFTPFYTAKLLWMTDFTTYDPFFILPIVSACLSSYSIILNPTSSSTVNPFFSIMPYMRYIPFLSLPFTCFFPAPMVMGWLTISLSQVILNKLTLSPVVIKYYLQGTKMYKDPNELENKRTRFVMAKLKANYCENIPKPMLLHHTVKGKKINPKKLYLSPVKLSAEEVAFNYSVNEQKNKAKQAKKDKKTYENSLLEEFETPVFEPKKEDKEKIKDKNFLFYKEEKKKTIAEKTKEQRKQKVEIPEIFGFATKFQKPIQQKPE